MLINRAHWLKQARATSVINYRSQDGSGAFPNEISLAQALFAPVLPISTPYPWPHIPLNAALLVLDISHWQGRVDFALMKSRGVRAVWIKATQGAWIDSQVHAYIQGAEQAGLDYGFYTFLDPTQALSAKQAARVCAEVVSGAGTLSLWLDAEREGNLSPTQLADYIAEFSGEFSVYDPRIQEIYTRLEWWNRRVARRTYWSKYRLNAARYNLSLSSPWSDGNYPPLDWPLSPWQGWQYSADGNGMGAYFGCQSGSVDLNVWQGTEADFAAAYDLRFVPEPAPEVYQDCFVTLFADQNFRTEPSTDRGSATVIRKLPTGSLLIAEPCPIENQPYTHTKTYIPGPARAQEIWLHGRVGTERGWLAAYHPSRSGAFVESVAPHKVEVQP